LKPWNAACSGPAAAAATANLVPNAINGLVITMTITPGQGDLPSSGRGEDWAVYDDTDILVGIEHSIVQRYQMNLPSIESLEARRLLSAGDQDMTFGTNGMVAVNETSRALLPAGNDKTYVVTTNHIEKHNADGSLDTTYGAVGIAGPTANVIEAHVQSDGRVVVVCGQTADEDTGRSAAAFSISRYTTAGQLDATFGTGGKIDVAKAFSGAFGAWEFGFQSDGKIVIRITDNDYNSSEHIYRLNTNGAIDSTFHTYAYQTLVNSNQPTPFAVDPDGKIYFTSVNKENSDGYTLTRLNSDGTLDTTFASNEVYQNIPNVFGVCPTGDGKVLVGTVAHTGTSDPMTAYRLNSDGSVDATFGSTVLNGLHSTTVDFGLSFGTRFQILSDGRILFWNPINVCRLSSDGVFDESFGKDTTIAPVIGRPVDKGSTPRIDIAGFVEQSGGGVLVAASNGLYRLQADGETLASPVHLDAQGTVLITGTDGNDQFAVTPSGTLATVRARGMFGRVYDLAAVKLISADLGAGDDWADITSMNTPSTMSGGDGFDSLIGGSGDDSLSGNAQNDALVGNAGNNRLAGNGGRDRIRGGAGNDRIYGGASSDWLYGGDGNDEIWGEGGNDRITGGDGADTLHGNAGNDTFLTSADSAIDQIFGDRGFDTCVSDPNDLWIGIEQVV
jgi:uncharacterized delta-60 repeat protein